METRGCSGLPLLWRQPKLARQIWLAHRRTFLPDQSGSGFRGSAAITPRLAPTAVKPGNPPTLHRSGRAANVSVPLFIAWHTPEAVMHSTFRRLVTDGERRSATGTHSPQT